MKHPRGAVVVNAKKRKRPNKHINLTAAGGCRLRAYR
jgi:hypothetical protein